ncbi:MAG: ATP-dependent DNA helicase RecG [Candidatus Dojkabacteria bacterium]|nr:ATP-dependent DNA helicase RecG [Candidatus Dojkabacteria bacterium]
MTLKANSKITDINGIGDILSKKFEKLDIKTVKQLLFHIPFRYQDSSHLLSIQEFIEKGEGTFIAKIIDVKNAYTRFRKIITTVKVTDEEKTLSITFFRQPYLSKILIKGETYIFDGKVTKKNGRKNIYNPKYELFKGEKEKQRNLGKLIGIYPETKGLTSNIIRKNIYKIKEDISKIVKDPLKQGDLETLPNAILKVHFPKDPDDIVHGRQRLAFDEMLSVAFKIEKNMSERENFKSEKIETNNKLVQDFIKSLPYKLTEDQEDAQEIILKEINKTIPMNRLINGDVGSGKTVVSAIAILNTIKQGYSAILLAPTTVLAKQHYDTFSTLYKGFKIPIELCISKEKKITKTKNKLIIGTHAILFKKDIPDNVALVVTDEQQRFGVEQREFLLTKSNTTPHHLTMTATPIPRTLTEAFFGNVSVSEIKEKPKGRIDIKSFYTPYRKRDDCFKWIAERIKKSRYKEQAFIIYPLIDESDITNTKSVLKSYEELKEKYFNDIPIAYLHGRLKEKNEILNDFKEKKYNILVSTSVIEVGIDIPDATIMVIENAERFGLAQLHQLRGRVGRSSKESYCYVIPGNSVERKSEGEERLIYFAKHDSGFDVAQYDLERRGPGEVYGTIQSGIPNFKVASIHDLGTLKKARKVAKEILKKDNNVDKILDNIFR